MKKYKSLSGDYVEINEHAILVKNQAWDQYLGRHVLRLWLSNGQYTDVNA